MNNGQATAALLLENGPIELRTRTTIYAKGPDSVDGEAIVDWTARLDAGSAGIGGISVNIVKVHAYGDRLHEAGDEELSEPFDIRYPTSDRPLPDDAEAEDIIDVLGDRPWRVELSVGDRFPRRPTDVEIDFKQQKLTVVFE